MAKPQPETQENLSESYISVGLGLLVVVVVGILLYNYFTQKTNQPKPETGEQVTEEATSAAKPGTEYTVVDGDTLWSISEKVYQTGYNWEEIAKANNLTENSVLEAGQKLMLPEVSTTPVVSLAPEASVTPVASAETVTTDPTPVPTPETVMAPVVTQPATITESGYTIIAGDTLWDIACRAYGDCYKWPTIAQANQLANPDLIYTGDKLNLPR